MQSILVFLNIPAVRFILLGTILYLGWYALYEFYLNPSTNVDEYIIDNLVFISESGLKSLGYQLTQYELEIFQDRIGIAGSPGVFIGEPCDGFVLFALFVVFIIAFPGPIKHKFWFVVVGVVLIHLINALRIIALVIIMNNNPQWLAFNHDYTFTIVVYSFVFFLWWTWINKFSPLRKDSKTK